MSTMACNDFRNQLEAWMEGERSPHASNHIRGCANCRRLVEDMDAIGRTAGVWAAEESDPPSRIWASLRVQLEQEGLIRGDVLGEASDQTKVPTGWFERFFTIAPRPALAGAYLAALIALAVVLTGPSNQRLNDDSWISGTQSSTGPLSAQLQTEQDSVPDVPGSNPVVTASLHENLAIVDNYIALCEKSVREDPQNEIARDYLYDAYQQKADLLAQMTERGVNGR